MIVVDVGSHSHTESDDSAKILAGLYRPSALYSFDPFDEGGRAAWTYDGEVGFLRDGTRSRVADGAPRVPCVDLARFINELPHEPDVVLKIDAEGAEYQLLPHLIDQGADQRLSLVWVEWHEPDGGRAEIEAQLACPIMEWRW